MRNQDAIGIGLSGLCLVHCLALPVLLSLAPALTWAEQEWVHLGLAIMALLVTVNALRSWPRDTLGMAMRGLAALGLGLLFFGALAEISELAERGVTVFGACLLASAHGLSWFLASRRGAHRH